MNSSKKDSRTFGFGSDYNDTYLLVDPDEEDPDVVEESDAFNNETFGEQTAADEEWDMENLSQQTEILNSSILDTNGTDSGIDVTSEPPMRTSVASDWYRTFEKSFEEMVEKSLRDLVSEDDEPSFSLSLVNTEQPNSDTKTTRLVGASASNPFLVVDPRTENIWGLGGTRPVDPASTTAAPNAGEKISAESEKPVASDVENRREPGDSHDPLQLLLTKLEMSARRTTHDGPEERRGEDGDRFRSSSRVKTVQELEAELLSDSRTTEGTNEVSRRPEASERPSAPEPDIESDSVSLKPPVQLRRQCVGGPPHLPPLAPWMLNPQLRATILACIAAGKPLPPGIAPPPFPMPMAGYITRFGHINPAYLPASMPNSDVGRFLVPTAATRPMQPASRLQLAPGQQPTVSTQHQNRYYIRQQRGSFNQLQSRGESRPPYDDYAGLMTKRERDWLMKIQALQVHCDDPFNDDYYWAMHKRKKEIRNKLNDETHTDDKNEATADLSSESIDVLEILEPRTYVPPSFEGSLGKVQCSSINCPRQIIDLQAAEHDGDANGGRGGSASAPDEVGCLSGTSSLSNRVSRSKHFTGLLLDIENAYLLALECEQLLIYQIGASRRSEKIKLISEQIWENTRKILPLISADSKKLCSVLLLKKGRRLILKIVPFLRDIELIHFIRQFFILISKTTAGNIDEMFAFLTTLLEAAVDSPVERDWTKVLFGFLDSFRPIIGFPSVKEKVDGLMLILLHYCLKHKTRLNRSTLDLLTEYANSTHLPQIGEQKAENNACKLRSLLVCLVDEHDREQDSVFMKLL